MDHDPRFLDLFAIGRDFQARRQNPNGESSYISLPGASINSATRSAAVYLIVKYLLTTVPPTASGTYSAVSRLNGNLVVYR